MFYYLLTHHSRKHYLVHLANYSQDNKDAEWHPPQRVQSPLPWGCTSDAS